MADTKLSALTETQTLTDTDEFYINDGGTSKRITKQYLDDNIDIALSQVNDVTASAAEVNLLDGSTANTVVNSKAVIYGSSGEVAAATIGLSGGQIAFPATQSASAGANTLDDYEEGTWTPVLSDGTNADATYTTQSGNYTKIGRLVTVSCQVTITSLGTISGNLRITGLPFASADIGVHGFAVGYGTALNIGAGENVSGYVSNGSSIIILTNWDNVVGVTNLSTTEFSADGSISFVFSYITS